jgi:hypothetical protein
MVAQASGPACCSGFPDVLPGRAAARHLAPHGWLDLRRKFA